MGNIMISIYHKSAHQLQAIYLLCVLIIMHQFFIHQMTVFLIKMLFVLFQTACILLIQLGDRINIWKATQTKKNYMHIIYIYLFVYVQNDNMHRIYNQGYDFQSMRRIHKGRSFMKRQSSLNMNQPYPIIALFSNENIQSLAMPGTKVRFAMNHHNILEKTQRLKLTASMSNSAVLGANQVGLNDNIIVMAKKLKKCEQNQKNLKWMDQSYSSIDDYEQIINPEILTAKDPFISVQQTLSMPFIVPTIWRYSKIMVKYFNAKNQQIQKQLIDVQARAFQHGFDYLCGRTIIDWRLHHGNLNFQEDMKPRLRKTSSVIQQYSSQLKSLLKEYPNLTTYPQQLKTAEQSAAFFINLNQTQTLSIQQDFVLRIIKHYKKQMAIFMQRMQLERQQKQKRLKSNKDQ